ncbi:MAG: transglycosylase SLT domain-containing protein [Peptostreptococcales bacterium]
MLKRILCTITVVVILTMMVVYANVDNNIGNSLAQEPEVAIEFKKFDGVEVYDRGINVNGQKINSYHSLYSFVVHNDIVYLPATYGNGQIFGLDINWNEENSQLHIENTKVKQGNYKEPWMKHNLKQFDMTTYMYKVNINGKSYQSLEYPILEYNRIAYIPLTYEIVNDYLHWDYCFDTDMGIYISTNKEVSAEDLVDLKEKEFYKALGNYAMSINKDLCEADAMNIVITMKDKCELYDMDKLLVFSTIWQESWFKPDTYYKGAIGLMQIMGRTGASAGLTPEMLYDPDTNIDFGISYLSDKMDRYDENALLALSAYNQGITRVDKGIYNPKYYNEIMEKKAKVEKYLEGQGLLAVVDTSTSIGNQ